MDKQFKEGDKVLVSDNGITWQDAMFIGYIEDNAHSRYKYCAKRECESWGSNWIFCKSVEQIARFGEEIEVSDNGTKWYKRKFITFVKERESPFMTCASEILDPKDATGLGIQHWKYARQISKAEEKSERIDTYSDCISVLDKKFDGEGMAFAGQARYVDELFPYSDKRQKQIISLAKLMHVADALNGEDCCNGREKSAYHIRYNYENKRCETCHFPSFTLQYGDVYFRSEKLAQKAINILGEGAIKEALGIFSK